MKPSLRLPALLLLLCGASAYAGTASWQGVFANDDDRALFSFTLTQADRLAAQTWSYAGGINAAGQAIHAGGFSPTLALFERTLGLVQLAVGSRNVCEGLAAFCWDARLDVQLAPGSYTLVLTQDGNLPLGPSLADGFSQEGRPDYTGLDFLGQPGLRFIQVDGRSASGHWALDLSAAPIPEPPPALLLAAGLLLHALRRGASRTRTCT